MDNLVQCSHSFKINFVSHISKKLSCFMFPEKQKAHRLYNFQNFPNPKPRTSNPEVPELERARGHQSFWILKTTQKIGIRT